LIIANNPKPDGKLPDCPDLEAAIDAACVVTAKHAAS
jgi:hypothetical protein